MEVPARLGGLAQHFLGPLIEGVSGVALDVGLAGQREVDIEPGLAEFLDLGLGARLLASELVAGHAQHHQTLIAIIAVKLLKPVVLGRQPTLRGRVHDQHHLVPIGLERQVAAFDGVELEVVGELGHGRAPPLGSCAA